MKSKWEMKIPSAKFFKTLARNVALLSLGGVLCSVAVKGILIPLAFVNGGFTGICMIINKLYPWMDLGTIYLVLNIPVFLLGWKAVSKRFFFYSVMGALIYSAAFNLVEVSIPVHSPVPAALLAGILHGLGAGIMFKSSGSAGGTDILSVFFLKRFSIRLSTTALALQISVLALALMFYELESILYTLMFMYVNAQMISLVTTGLSQRKAVSIISENYEALSQRIIGELNRGATLLSASGAYSGRDAKMLYTVVATRDLSKLKRIVNEEDPNAFLVVQPTLEVMGHRIGNQLNF